MRPLIQKKILFDNTCGCVVNHDVLEKALIWYSKLNTLKSPRKIFMYGNYPAVSSYDSKIHVHRIIMCYVSGFILPNDMYVHHKDGNKFNSSIDNLEIMEMSKHQSIHNIGKTLSDSQKKLISDANRRRKGISTAPRTDIPISKVKSMFENGNTIAEISRYFYCGWSTIKKIINKESDINSIEGKETNS